jgi:hypothetical protein
MFVPSDKLPLRICHRKATSPSIQLPSGMYRITANIPTFLSNVVETVKYYDFNGPVVDANG